MMNEIADELNARGLKTSKGNLFRTASISLILKNRKYIGEYSNKDVVIPDGIPAIVDKAIFDRVQERLKLNSKAPARKKANEEYLLSMKLFCGSCGRIMVGESGTSSTKGVVHQYYKCGGAKRHLGCKRKAIKKHWIEDVVIIQTVSKVLKDKEIDRLADRIIELQNQEDTTIPAMQRQLQESEKGIENMLNAIQMGILTSSTKERLEQLEAQRDELKTAILQAQLVKPKYTKEQIVSWIRRFKYGNLNDPEYRRQIVDTFVNAVYVYDDRLVFTYNFKDGTETITKKEIEEAFSSDLSESAPP